MNLFIDIETVPDGPPPEPVPYDPETFDPSGIVAPSNWKDPAKIEAYRQEAEGRARSAHEAAHEAAHERDLEVWRKGSLDPLRGRVLLCGVAIDHEDAFVIQGPDEESVLRDVERVVSDAARRTEGLSGPCTLLPDSCLIRTWNGASFDRPFLAKRAIRHGLYGLADVMRVSRPWVSGDLHEVWRMGDRRVYTSLDAACAFLGIERNNPISGADVCARWLAGDERTIARHCLDDIEVLREIHGRMVLAGWVA